ncbi:hypothetical protein Tco_0295515 [Tanacetum coccineum]
MEQMTSICDMVGQIMQKKEEERQIVEDQAAKDRYWKIPICYDDDEDYTIAITPVLLTKEPVDSLIMEDEHSESEGIPESVCDMPLCNNPTPLEAFKEHSENCSDFINDSTFSSDDDFSLTWLPPPSPPPFTPLACSTTTRSDLSLPDYEDFYLNEDHIEDKSNGSTTTHADFSQYDSFVFDLLINPFPPTDRSDFYHEEFVDDTLSTSYTQHQ